MISTIALAPAALGNYFKVVNFVIFQSVWLLGVFAGNSYVVASIALVALHFYTSPARRSDLMTILVVAPIGACVDFILSLTSVFVFDTTMIPIWLFVLWLAFALTIVHSMDWIKKMPIYVQALLGMFGGTSSYYAGYRFGAVDFTYSDIQTCIILAFVWGCKIPLFYYLVGKYVKRENIS